MHRDIIFAFLIGVIFGILTTSFLTILLYFAYGY